MVIEAIVTVLEAVGDAQDDMLSYVVFIHICADPETGARSLGAPDAEVG
jgi:hypothetical protein